MKLYTFEYAGRRRIGADGQGQLVDLQATYAAMLSARGPKPGALPELPGEMLSFLRLGEPAQAAARETLAFMAKRPAVPVGDRLAYAFEEVTLLAPILRPGKILCTGTHDRSHLEQGSPAGLSAEPIFFAKFPSKIIGPGAPIVYPKRTGQLDFGAGLAAVIGKRMKNTPENEVMSCIAGYTILNDVSAHDLPLKNNQLTLGKNFDTFCPLGPCIVTADELPNLGQVRWRASINGEPKQEGWSSDSAFPWPKLLHALSEVMTLEPGDIVSMEMSAPVDGLSRPTVFLKPGDVVTLEIDGIGTLENPVLAAPH